ncbi:MAG: ABC transporter permease [Candidatus Methanomethylicia archaeon]
MGLRRYIVKRGIDTTITFFIIIIINFLLPRLMPGDPVSRLIGSRVQMSYEERIALLKTYGLDKQLHEQFIIYLSNLLRGDLGVSLSRYPTPVIEVLMYGLPWTILLVGFSTFLAILIGTVLGIISGWRRGGRFDIASLIVALATYSTPVFWIGMLLIFFFAVRIRIFPIGGAFDPEFITFAFSPAYILNVIKHMVLPTIALTLILYGGQYLIVRSSIIETLTEDYILTAYAKGLKESTIMFKHAARNALLPAISYAAIEIGLIVAGAVLTETVFSWPGVGTIIYNAVSDRDYPVIQGAFFIIALSVLLANFIADIVYGVLDPRIRYG